MKHYTLAEHHTFCVESGIPGVDVWREVVKLGWLPEGIYHDPAHAFNPKYKAKQKKYKKKYRSTPEGNLKARQSQTKRQSTSEYKEWRKEYYRRNKK